MLGVADYDAEFPIGSTASASAYRFVVLAQFDTYLDVGGGRCISVELHVRFDC